VGGALACVLTAGPVHAQQKVLAGFAATPTVSVRLFAAVGTVQVLGWDRDSVQVSGVVPADTRVEMGPLRSTKKIEGFKLFIEAATEKGAREGKLTFHVPRGARVWLKTGSSRIEVSDVTGGLDLNVVGGSITVHGNPRELRAESMDGAVTVDGTPEWMRVKTATGDIVLRGGQNIGASTISGTIDAQGGQVDHAVLETTTGAIRFALGLARGATVQMETHSGPIDVRLPRKAEAEVDAASVTREIENSWSRVRPVAGREGRGMTLTNSGGISGGRVVVRSFKGRITLRGS
jgi:hypothetical protein